MADYNFADELLGLKKERDEEVVVPLEELTRNELYDDIFHGGGRGLLASGEFNSSSGTGEWVG